MLMVRLVVTWEKGLPLWQQQLRMKAQAIMGDYGLWEPKTH